VSEKFLSLYTSVLRQVTTVAAEIKQNAHWRQFDSVDKTVIRENMNHYTRYVRNTCFNLLDFSVAMFLRITSLFVVLLAVSGCSLFGDNGVESAPYSLLHEAPEKSIEVRNYESMILVSADMAEDGRNGAFRQLFKYITGNNQGNAEIAMTAPVFMDEKGNKEDQMGMEIAMTAPVFMNEGKNPTMSFVMPAEFTLESTPKPSSEGVWVTEVENYKVAAIQFSGTLRDANVSKHTELLTQWIVENGYEIAGNPVLAGYNGPLTIPMFRKNEVLIQIN
jgi:hypothetical protein